MALLLDASTPASFSAKPGTSATSASFTPPDNSLIRLKLGIAYGGAVDPTITNTGTGVGTWRQVVKRTSGAFSGVNCSVYIYEAVVTTGSAITVKADFTSTGTFDIYGWAEVWTGAASVQTTAASGSNTAVGFPVTPFTTTGLVTTAAGSEVHGIAMVDAASAMSSTDSGSGQIGSGGAAAFSAYKAATTPGSGTSVTLQFGSAGAPSNAIYAVAEMLAGGAAAASQYTDSPNRARPGRGPFSKGKFALADATAFSQGQNVTVGLTGQAATFASGSLSALISRIYTDDPAQARPGRGPFSRGKFYVSDTSAQTAPNGNVTLALTGQSAAMAAGNMGAAITAALSGQQTTLSAGAVLAASQLVVSGQPATTSAGSLTGSSQVALTGQSGASTAGTVIPGLQVTLVGQAASFASGALALGSTVVLAGQSASFTPGNLVASGGGNVTLALTGQSTAFASGALLPSSSAVLTGQAITSAVGLVGPARSLAFTGQAATFAAGNLLASSAVGVTGQSGSFTAGVVTPPNGVTTSLTGQAASFASGSITSSVTVGLTGQSLASNTGTLAAANAQALAGSAITSASGTLLGSFTVALVDQQAIFAGGLVLPPSDKTASLTGSVATFRAGTVLAIGAVLTGTPRYVVRRSQKRIFTVSAVTYSQFPPKDPAEAVKLEFDFADDLDSGVLLSGTPVVTVTVSGADPTPTGIFNGLPRFDTTSTQVIVPVVAGVANCDYDVKVVVPTTDSLTVLALNGILPVRA